MSKSLVLNEALSIPSVIENFSNVDNNPYLEISNLINQKKIKYVVTIARGTSDCAALYSSYIFAKYLGLPSYSMPPSIITLEKSTFNFTDALVIVISQSGKSKDLIECEKQCRSMGAKTILISNNEKSPIVNETNYFFNMFAGEEKSVAATKSFVQTLLILIKLVFFIKGKKDINDSIKKLGQMLIQDSDNHWDPNIVNNQVNAGFIIGRGVGFALSNEISLKFKELCQEMIEPFSSAEVMHGPKSLIQNSFKLITISLDDPSGNSVLNDSKKLIKITNKVYSIGSDLNKTSNLTYKSLNSPELDSIIIMSKFYPWIIKYSKSKKLDPDNPRYLTKVTHTL